MWIFHLNWTYKLSIGNFFYRLQAHIEYYFNHTMEFISGKSMSCRPIFDIFDAIRQLFCRHIVDPINALWFFSFTTLVLWVFSTPTALALSVVFRKIHALNKRIKRSSSSYRQGSRFQD